jgi:hypothetical protein
MMSQNLRSGVSIDTALSADEIEVQFKGEVQGFASLAELGSQ